MVPYIVLAFSSFGWCSSDPPVSEPERAPRSVPQLDPDAFRDQELQRTRRARAFLEENVEFFEKILEKHSNRLSPTTVSQIKRDLEKMRAEVEEMKKYERKLMATKSADNTVPLAPMPHLPTGPMPCEKRGD